MGRKFDNNDLLCLVCVVQLNLNITHLYKEVFDITNDILCPS